MQSGDSGIINQLSSCCCNILSAVERQGAATQLQNCQNVNALTNTINGGVRDLMPMSEVFGRMERLLVGHGMQDTYDMYLCKVNMADVQLNLGNTDEAARLLDEAYAYFMKVGDAVALYYCRTIGIGLALRAGDTAKVRRILDLDDPKATIDFNLVNIRHRYLLEYFVKKGDYRRAYFLLDYNVRRNDSLKHNLANMRASEIMMRYEQDTLKLNHQIEIQEKDADIRAAHMWLYVGVLLIVVLVLLLSTSFPTAQVLLRLSVL